MGESLIDEKALVEGLREAGHDTHLRVLFCEAILFGGVKGTPPLWCPLKKGHTHVPCLFARFPN